MDCTSQMNAEAGERFEQEHIDQAEHRRVRSDPKSQDDQCQDRESGCPHQLPNGQLKVIHKTHLQSPSSKNPDGLSMDARIRGAFAGGMPCGDMRRIDQSWTLDGKPSSSPVAFALHDLMGTAGQPGCSLDPVLTVNAC